MTIVFLLFCVSSLYYSFLEQEIFSYISSALIQYFLIITYDLYIVCSYPNCNTKIPAEVTLAHLIPDLQVLELYTQIRGFYAAVKCRYSCVRKIFLKQS